MHLDEDARTVHERRRSVAGSMAGMLSLSFASRDDGNEFVVRV